jgi:glycosyltransferase involved in cell wall biosynthesis
MSHRAVVVTPKLPFPPVSGGVKRTLRLLEALRSAGAQVAVLTQDAGAPGDAEQLRHLGYELEVAPVRNPSRLAPHLRREPIHAGSELVAAIGATAPGASFLQLEHPHLGAAIRATRKSTWVLSTQNVDSEMGWRGSARGTELARSLYHRDRLRHMQRVTARAAVATICVSDADAAYFERYSRRVIIAPNGVDPDFFAITPDLPDNDDVLFFGQFSYAPNAEGAERFLAEGWPRLAAARPRARLLLAGQGSTEAIVPRDERVQVLGIVDDLPEAIRRSRAIVIPVWRGGGTRLKALEALAAARPGVSTALRVAGIGFQPGVHGVIDDRPDGLADALAHVLGDAAKSADLAAAARDHARTYTWDRTLEPARQLYQELLSGPS